MRSPEKTIRLTLKKNSLASRTIGVLKDVTKTSLVKYTSNNLSKRSLAEKLGEKMLERIVKTLLTTAFITGVAFCGAQNIAAATITVVAGQSIQAAINSASVGDRIEVGAGTYEGPITIDKTLTIVGAGRDVTVINGPTQANGGQENCAVCISGTGVDFSGFTVNGGKAYWSIGLQTYGPGNRITNNRFSILPDTIIWPARVSLRAHNYGVAPAPVVIENNIFANNLSGCSVCVAGNSSFVVVRNNLFSNSLFGIQFANGSSEDSVVERNQIEVFAHGQGVAWGAGTNRVGHELKVQDNFITHTGSAGGVGIVGNTYDGTDGLIVQRNVVVGNFSLGLGFAGNRRDYRVSFLDNVVVRRSDTATTGACGVPPTTDTTGVSIPGTSRIIVQGNRIAGWKYGIYFWVSLGPHFINNNNFVGNTTHAVDRWQIGAIHNESNWDSNFWQGISASPYHILGIFNEQLGVRVGTDYSPLSATSPEVIARGLDCSAVMVAPNTAPTVSAGGPYSGSVGSTIAMSGATAADPDPADTLTYAWTVNSTSCSFNNAGLLSPNVTCSIVGNFTATLSVSDGVNPAVTSNASVTVNAASSTTTVTCTAGAPYTYTGSAQTPCTAGYTTSDGLSGSLTVSYTDNTVAGTAGASASYDGDATHEGSSGSGSYVIGEASSSVTVTCTNGAPFTYTGSAQEPCTAGYTTSDGLSGPLTVIHTDNNVVGSAGASASYGGDANHNGSDGSSSFVIGQASSVTKVTCAPTSVTYNGSAQTPCTASYSGAGGLSGSLTVSYTNNTNAGPAGASASYGGDANHEGSTAEKTFTINKAPTTTVVTFESGSYVFRGTAFTATAQVTGAGGLIQPQSVSYTGNCTFVTMPGGCSATATYAETANYLGSTDSDSITILSGCTFDGFRSPIGGAVENGNGGSSLTPVRTFKLGSTIPVKFGATCFGTPLTGGIHVLQAQLWNSGTSMLADPIDATPTDAATTGIAFRLTGTEWHYNLDTKNTPGFSQGTWLLKATLYDGSTYTVWVALKK